MFIEVSFMILVKTGNLSFATLLIYLTNKIAVPYEIAIDSIEYAQRYRIEKRISNFPDERIMRCHIMKSKNRCKYNNNAIRIKIKILIIALCHNKFKKYSKPEDRLCRILYLVTCSKI